MPPKNSLATSALLADDRRSAALAAALDPAPVPSIEERRTADAIAAKAIVENSPAFRAWQALALETVPLGDVVATEIDRQFRALRPDAYTQWLTERRHSFNGDELLPRTNKARAHYDAIRARFPGQAAPFPVTATDISALNARLTTFDNAGPSDAEVMIADAQRRGDVPFLWAAGARIRAWQGKRNVWSGPDVRDLTERMLADIALATHTTENAQHEYAVRLTDAAWASWKLLINLLQDGKRVDPVYRQTGALRPLLEPSAK